MRLVSVFLFIFIAACAQPPQDLQDGGNTYHVYFLGGQSNMEGYGRVGHLRGEHAQTHDAIRIFTGNPQGDNGENGGHGRWTALRPGFGQKFSASSERVKRSRYFGPEITFGLEMARLNPDQNIAIIKYARGGSSLAFDAPNFGTWSPDRETFQGENQYDYARHAIRSALATPDIDGDGLRDTLIPAGLIWMQGESDAIEEPPAQVYEENLRQMMNLLRISLGAPDMPVIIGKITDSGMDEDGQVMDFIAPVQAAQARYVASQRCAAYVTEIDDYQHISDGWHYDSEAYLKMGAAFARAMTETAASCEPV